MLAPPLPPLAAPDDLLLELETPPLRTDTQKQTQRNTKIITEIERERARGQAILIIEF